MSDKNFKLIRKQLRNVVKEALPEVMQNELIDAIEKRLADKVNKKLTTLNTSVEKQLEEMQKRQKDIQTYVVSKLGNQTPLATE